MSAIFSARLIALRKERKLSQEDIGNLIQKKRSTISGYETEGKEPDIDTICQLARFFDVSTDYLLGNSDERKNVDSVFFGDSGGKFEKTYETLPASVRPLVAKCFEQFYRLLNHDVRLARTERLEVYRELLREMTDLRLKISHMVETSGSSLSDPVALSQLMAMQAELKNAVSSLLDKLMQADMEVSFDIRAKEASPSLKSAV